MKRKELICWHWGENDGGDLDPATFFEGYGRFRSGKKEIQAIILKMKWGERTEKERALKGDMAISHRRRRTYAYSGCRGRARDWVPGV